jgi:hypothetical protein
VLVVATIALEGFMVLLGLQLGSRESDQRGQRTGPTGRRCVDHQSCVDL